MTTVPLPAKATIWGRLGIVESCTVNPNGTVSVAFRLRRRAGPTVIKEVQNYRLQTITEIRWWRL